MRQHELERGPSEGLNRRGFLRATGAAAAAAGLAAGSNSGVAAQQAEPRVLPRRPLGKTGVEVTILNLGTWQSPGLDRLVRFAYAQGVRYFDAAKSYGSEPGLKRWFQAAPEVRDQIFLVTKDSPREPRDLLRMADERLASLGTDRIDLFFVHALGDRSEQAGLEWPKSAELGRVAEQLKKAGKIKFFGFSSHHRRRAEFLQAAAQGGFIDAIMLQYHPWLDKESPLNRALDACHAKGIGLISMKQVAGQFGGGADNPGLDVLAEVKRRVPMLAERKLSPYQGLLQAIWSDERIASACVSMRNTDQIRENTDAARRFEPLKEAEIRALHDASLAHGRTLCADCDGRCMAAAGTEARLGDLTRYLTYHDHHGHRAEARRLYAELSDAERGWQGADLAAAQRACPSRLDFARLLPKADERLA
jgi:aryl-alcohol dehydrogenase-like predicted oxidoreductase